MGSIENLIISRESEVNIYSARIKEVKFSYKSQIFYLETSRLNITECSLEKIFITNYFEMDSGILDAVNSIIYWNKVNIIDSTFYANKFINGWNSSILIKDLNMINNSIESNFNFINDNMLLTVDRETGEKALIFERCKIIGINSKNYSFSFLAVASPQKEISIKFSIFKNVHSFGKVIQIECFVLNFFLNDVLFVSNSVDSHLYITSSKFIEIFNVTFFVNNFDSDIYRLRGSCLVLLENMYCSLNNIKLINTVTFSSASIILTNHNLEGLITITKCMFLNNRLQITYFFAENFEKGGVLKIYTSSHFFLNNSVFLNNILDIENSKVISASCITIVSENIIVIDNSVFKQNRSPKFSNCLYIIADALKITNSYFLNNTISTISNVQFEIMKIKRECGSKFKVEESKGGSIYFSGNNLIIISSIFKDNKANVGSAIFIDDKNSNVPSIFIKIENCSFIRNYAIFTSTIGFDFFRPFEIKIITSSFANNMACNGGVIYLKVKSKANFSLERNFFLKNVASCGPVIFVDEGFVVFRNRKNVFMRNFPFAEIAKAGGTAYIVNSPFGSIILEDEAYIENECYQGVISLFRGKGLEVNGKYIRNHGLFVSVLAMTNLASYEGTNIKLIDNASDVFGCIAIFDTCTILLDNVIFKNCSSYHRGSCLSLQISCKLLMNQGIFFLNYLNSANIIEFQLLEDQPVLNNCIFWKNNANSKFFDIISSSIYLNNSIFAENYGCILTLSIAEGFLQNLIFKNSSSKANLISIYDDSILIIIESHFQDQKTGEGLFYSENSKFLLNYTNFLHIYGCSKGGTFNSLNSIISISNSNLTRIENNAFSSANDIIFLDQITIFNKWYAGENKLPLYGIFLLKFPKLVRIQKTNFVGNSDVFMVGLFLFFIQ